MPKTISIDGAFRFGWNKFKEHWIFLLVALIFFYGISGGLNYLSDSYFKEIEPTATLLGIISYIFLAFISYIFLAWIYFNLIRIYLLITENQVPRIEHLFSYDPIVWRFIVSSIIFYFIVGVGFLLFIIPGIYLYLRYGMYMYLIADRRLGIFESLRESARITDGVKWSLLFMGVLTVVVVMFLGALALGVGLLIVIPVIGLAYTHVYRSLIDQSDGERSSSMNPVTPLATVSPVPLANSEPSTPHISLSILPTQKTETKQ